MLLASTTINSNEPTFKLRSRQLFADLAERGAELFTHGAQSNNDANSDQSSDQAVFDGGRAGFVFSEAVQKVTHVKSYLV